MKLFEIKLSRVHQYFTSDDRPAAIITAFRGNRTLDHNIRLNKQLASSLRSAGFGFTWVDGAWIENQGTPEEAHESEVSILVFGDQGTDQKLFDLLVTAAQQYDQDAFVFRGKISDGKIGIYDKYGKLMDSYDVTKLDTLGSLYTRLRSGNHRGRSFVFMGERAPVGYAGRLLGKED